MDAIEHTEYLRKTRLDLVIHPYALIYPGTIIGQRCKIQAGAIIVPGVELEEDVFVGPGVVFTNVKQPSARVKAENFEGTLVKRGAVIGANSTIVCPRIIEEEAFIGAGSVVTRNISAFHMAYGNPAVAYPPKPPDW
jgi:UDP-2-acetamido-3-amino-2,3-dideoxy-glucuronate N-acetyltransferase